MVSNFGGDGGDVLVDPNDGCNIVQEYVDLSMSVTQTCAHPTWNPKHADAFLDPTKATSFKIAPPDVNARFIAPFVANEQNIDEWLAGGNSLWLQEKGFAIRKPSRVDEGVHAREPAEPADTALAMSGNEAIGGWCGPLQQQRLRPRRRRSGRRRMASGRSPRRRLERGLPNRYIGGVAIGAGRCVLRRSERLLPHASPRARAPGSATCSRSTDSGDSWTDISANFPDVPANSIKALADGSLVVGTDLGVLVPRQPGARSWKRLGDEPAADGRDGRRARPRQQHLRGDLRPRDLAHRAPQ